MLDASSAARAGIAALAIDGPFHGDRADAGAGPLDYQERVAVEGARTLHDRMSEDWMHVLAAAAESGWVDEQRVAFLGMFDGRPVRVAGLRCSGARLRCAVLGKFGLTQSELLPRSLAANDLIADAAESIRAPVLQHVQWQHELFPLAGQLELFDRFSSTEKVLRGRLGPHPQTRPDDEMAWRDYITAQLNRT